MLCTVSTVKDSRRNVERMVERNLASGADHMFIFLEGDEDGTFQYLCDHPFVTPVMADDSYWGADRPDRLFRRQLVNANLANCLVSPFPAVQWLVHLDADECLEIDKKKLVSLDLDIRAVRLGVLEAVSVENGPDDAEYFKKKLMPQQLATLTELGVIEGPDNRHYLRGYLIGKAAVRPGLDLDMGVHRALMKTGEPIEHLRGPGFRILHYESVSPDDFVSKWETRLSGGPTYREERSKVADAVAAVIADDAADAAQKRTEFRAIYKRYVEDPVDLLLEHGLLVKPRPKRHAYRPENFADDEIEELGELLTRLVRKDKERFRSKGPAESAVEVMVEVRDELGPRHRALAERIDAAVGRAAPRLDTSRT